MGFDVPEPYKWDDSFMVFYNTLDEEHKGLFIGIFDLCKAPDNQAAKESLYKLCADHFSTEEGMLESSKYEEFAAHKTIHDKFLTDLKGVVLPISIEKQTWAKEWLVNHIKGTDFKYKGKLN
uniref:Hemerythrin n=1 Tax=Paramphinome jeffreysii TaxID=222009 RepID=A0A1S6QCR7_PARJE|nr:hemerythrin [Paramphinome jeffreysii]